MPKIGERLLKRAGLDIASDLTELEKVRGFLQEVGKNRPVDLMSRQSAAMLELAVIEAVSNIIRHAYGGMTEGEIRIDVEIDAECITIKMRHGGAAFEPDALEDPVFDGSRSGGFGCYLMKRCVDEVRYTRDDRGSNLVTLVKKLNKEDRDAYAR